MNKIKFTSLTIALILVLTSLVYAFGVAAPGTIVKVYPGETKIVNLNLQNKAGATESVTARLEIKEGEDIGSLEKNEYTVEAGSELDAPVTIKIPDDAAVGATYSVLVEAKTMNPGDAGGVAIGIGMDSAISLVVIEEPVPPETETPKSKTWIIAIVVIIVVAIVLLVILKRRTRI
jgi:hypothetical protein